MVLHNYIRHHHTRLDKHFNRCDQDKEFIYDEAYFYQNENSSADNSGSNNDYDENSIVDDDGDSKRYMMIIRDHIAHDLISGGC
ncbi:hypothetical protein AXF42_Ash013325 [Apostasia shenzhenica]|uniref:Uncharacterized protein n=1 Tax=Apostasia shenzhenica TaxID=1088818 RepID=A0A2I0BBN0_9ASPA|nr:hypothetical protein AXF42_Ash013325 [Apostasia shenzhenica]